VHALVFTKVESLQGDRREGVHVAPQVVGVVNKRENAAVVMWVAVLISQRQTGRQTQGVNDVSASALRDVEHALEQAGRSAKVAIKDALAAALAQ
jgi:hypothetical protein